MRSFFRFLRGRAGEIAAFFCFFLVFFISFALYKLPLGAVLYPFFLCAAAGAAALAFDYRRTVLFCKAAEKFSPEADDILPPPKTEIERAERNIISNLRKTLLSERANGETLINSALSGYTVWLHEMKTPISSMRLRLENEDSPQSRRLLSDLFRTERCAEAALATLRVGFSSTDYVFRSHNVSDMVNAAIRRFSYEFIEKRLYVETENLDRVIITDEKWFIFVLEQLLQNALKYTREGGVKIYIRDDRLNIEDTGSGIPPEDLPRIFEEGFTGQNGRTDRRASGIGLYLCKKICDNLGLSVSAQSVFGSFTWITISLSQRSVSD